MKNGIDGLMARGQAAKFLGIPPRRFEYLISKYGIEERARVGIVRLFGVDQVKLLAEEINAPAPVQEVSTHVV